jgi:hypothetical protein
MKRKVMEMETMSDESMRRRQSERSWSPFPLLTRNGYLETEPTESNPDAVSRMTNKDLLIENGQ